jgi:hypothetical protein
MIAISKTEKVRLLNKLLDKSQSISVESSSDINFKSWKNLVERTFLKVFGNESPEFIHFNKLSFNYYTPITIGPSYTDYSQDHLRTFRESFSMLISSIEQYIEELVEQEDASPIEALINKDKSLSKVFISHASKDVKIVEEVIEMLESFGLESTQIFCTSFEGYGIDLGENFLDKIKDELSSESLVIFLLSKNFYESPVCLCEMGATWVLSNEHIPILIPPLDYKNVQGVIPLTQGLKVNEPLKLNQLKEKIERLFKIKRNMPFSTWERKRDRIVERIEKLIPQCD